MKISGNTILITGGGSGIGQALARAFHAAGNQVIIAGRRIETLEETLQGCPGMKAMTLDVEDPAAIRAFGAQITAEFPALNVLLNNAGIMRVENILEQSPDLGDIEATITTNLLGPLRLTAALLPHLQKQSESAIINVTSGLAFVPLTATPTYNATKAALHSYSESLRYQLRATPVQVIEIVPPGVATELTPGQSSRPHMMPLANFITETMQLLENQPNAPEICVENVKWLRNAEASGKYEAAFAMLNETTE